MQIVIDIPKVMYINAKRDLLFGADILVNAIKNGTPLPKGHGKLIDFDMLWDLYHDNDYDFYEALDDVQTIIIKRQVVMRR